MTTERPKIAGDLEVDEVDDGLVVFQERTERVHHLNATAAVVFQLCDGRRDRAEIAAIVGDLFGLDHEPAGEVQSCIDRLAQEGLVG